MTALAWPVRRRVPVTFVVEIAADAAEETCRVTCATCGDWTRAVHPRAVRYADPARVGPWWARELRGKGCMHWTNATEAAVARSINEGWA